MFRLKIFFGALAILNIATSLALAEKIEPVELKYECEEADLYDWEEPPDTIPVLLLHGLGLSRRFLQPLIKFMFVTVERRVCAVDLRNHGDSPWSNRMDVAALTEDVAHFLDTQGIKRVNIVGHNIGAKVGAHFALKHPDRVESLIIDEFRPNNVTKEALTDMILQFSILEEGTFFIPGNTSYEQGQKDLQKYLEKELYSLAIRTKVPQFLYLLFDIKIVDGRWQFRFNIEEVLNSLENPEQFLTESKGLYEGPVLIGYGKESPHRLLDDKENILKLFPNAQFVPLEYGNLLINAIINDRYFDRETVLPFLQERD